MKFFRKLRQRMLKERKISRYLLYAIGEIILVLIGILLALQINSWQKHKSDKEIIGLHVIAILDETKENITELNEVIDQMEYFDRENRILLDLYDQKDFDNPLMEQKTFILYGNRAFIPTTNSFENLKNSPLYAMIDNFQVKKALADAYKTFDLIKMSEEIDKIPKKAFYTDYVLPNASLFNNMEKPSTFYANLYYGNILLSVLQTNSDIANQASRALAKMEGLEIVLINYYNSLDIGTLNNRTNILEYIERGDTPEEIITLARKQDPNNPKVVISENVLNSFGYRLLRNNKEQDALKIFKLNIELYPKSSNTHDSYGEGLLVTGDTIGAVKAYKKALELNPNNTTAPQVIERYKKSNNTD